MAIRCMAVVAHQDDFEFGAGGLFASLRDRYGNDVELKILATTRGASGHHQMGLEQTFRRREAEALRSAALIGADYECLKCLDGNHVPGQFFIDRNTLGGLWNAIRKFAPDYIFCPPPLNPDPLAGAHIDHVNTGQGVRLVAYQLIVPNAYPTINTEVKKRVKSPLIINLDDGYSGENQYHAALDISAVYELKTSMALCHESQVFEWLPWTSGNDNAITPDEFREEFIQRHILINARYSFNDNIPREFFRFTRWGREATSEDRKILFNKNCVFK